MSPNGPCSLLLTCELMFSVLVGPGRVHSFHDHVMREQRAKRQVRHALMQGDSATSQLQQRRHEGNSSCDPTYSLTPRCSLWPIAATALTLVWSTGMCTVRLKYETLSCWYFLLEKPLSATRTWWSSLRTLGRSAKSTTQYTTGGECARFGRRGIDRVLGWSAAGTTGTRIHIVHRE